MNRRSISIVVPCCNEVRHIRAFLDSLLGLDTGGLDYEVIIADGMSTDGTRQILAEYARRAPLRCIDNPERIVSTALNRAIRGATGEFVLRMDIHTEYAPDYVRRCVETLIEKEAWNAGGPARTRAEGWMPRAIAAAYHSPFACGGARFHDENFEGWVDTVTYGCWRKSTLEQIGLFDESLVRNQDDELNLRIVRSGGRIWQSPAIVSWYHPRSTLSQLARQYFQYGFWKVAVIRKHRLPASWRHLAPGAFCLSAVLGLPLAGLFWLAGLPGVAAYAVVLWAAGIVAYAAACLAAAAPAAARAGWDLFPVLPLVFTSYHLSYGTGFLLGIILRPGGRPGAGRQRFAELTR